MILAAILTILNVHHVTSEEFEPSLVSRKRSRESKPRSKHRYFAKSNLPAQNFEAKKMETNRSMILLAATVWIILIGCMAGIIQDGSTASKPRNFAILKNVLEASKVNSCNQVPERNFTKKRGRRSVEEEDDLGEPSCLDETDPIYYVSKYHRSVCHMSVELAYEVFFGRQPSEDEFETWYQKCVSREIDEAYMMWKFAESDEHMDFLGMKRKEKQERDSESSEKDSDSESGLEVDAEVEAEIPVTIPLKLRVKDEEYLEALDNPESDEFKELSDAYADALLELLREMPGLLGVKILGFKKGSLIVFYQLVFDDSVETVAKLYDDDAENEVDYDNADEIHPFDSEKFAQKIKDKVKGVIKEALRKKQEAGTILDEAHVDLESIDTIPEDEVNDLVQMNPDAPVVTLDLTSRNHTANNATHAEEVTPEYESENDSSPQTETEDKSESSGNSPEEPDYSNAGVPTTSAPHTVEDSTDSTTDATQFQGADLESDSQPDLAEQNDSPTHNDNPTTEPNRDMRGSENSEDHDIEHNDATLANDNANHDGSKYEESNEENATDQDAIKHEPDAKKSDDISHTELPQSDLQEPSYSPLQSTTGSNNDSDSNTPTPINEDGFPMTKEDDEIVVTTTEYPRLEHVSTTAPTTYPEIPSVGTLADIGNSFEPVTTYPTPKTTQSTYESVTTSAAEDFATTDDITTSPVTYPLTYPSPTDSTLMEQPSLPISQSTTARPTTSLTIMETTTTTSTNVPVTEAETTTGVDEENIDSTPPDWDTEYLDSLDDDYHYDYGYESDITDDDVTVSETPSGDSTTSTGRTTAATTTEATTVSFGSRESKLDEVTSVNSGEMQANTVENANSSKTQIPSTPERAEPVVKGEEKQTSVNSTAPNQTVMMKLRVTNMNYTKNLTDRQSEEFQLLEAKFSQLLRPLLQSLEGFVDMEVLGFSYGSLIVNNEILFAKVAPDNVKEEVKERIKAAAAYFKYARLAVDADSTEVIRPDEANLCEFVQCHLYSNCVVRNGYRTECVCRPGYIPIDPSQCVSVCSLDQGYCQNRGKCEIVEGKGPVCRCVVSFNWGFKGERCEEPLPRSILLVSSSTGAALLVFFILLGAFCYTIHRRKKNAKAQKREKMADKDFMRAAQSMSSPGQRRSEDLQRVNPVFLTENETQNKGSENAIQGHCPHGSPHSLSDKSIGSMSTHSFVVHDHLVNNGPLPSDLSSPARRLLRLQIESYANHKGTWGRRNLGEMNMRCPRPEPVGGRRRVVTEEDIEL